MAGLFNAMLDDIDGRQRLEGDLAEVDGQDAAGKPMKVRKLATKWDKLRLEFVAFYAPKPGKDDDAPLHKQLREEAEKVYQRHVQGLNEFVKENGGKIKAHFEALKRYEEGRKTDPHTTFQAQRRWDEMQDLRKEAKGWIAELESRESALKRDLSDLLRKERKSEVEAVLRDDKADALALLAYRKKAAEPEAKKPAKKPADTDTKKPADTETKKPDAGAAPPKPATSDKTPESAKAKASPEEKPADPPKDRSSEPAKLKPTSIETLESGSEEADDAEASKKAAEKSAAEKTPAKAGGKKSDQDKVESKAAADKTAANKVDGAGAKPPAAAKAKSDDELKKIAEKYKNKTDAELQKLADATVEVVDFSPLAGPPEEGFNPLPAPKNDPFPPSWNPFQWQRTEQLAFLLTWSLFAIGLCLMLGLFTRPAALAGAGFMLFVVMSQPSYPGVWPPDPAQLGHALLVNKDFVEMIALLVIASTSLGRWTGLDFFLHNFVVKPFCCRCCKKSKTEGQKA
jgi:uncharacterized membrane protein YphA (DoxX/SURF4 family)